MENLVKLNCQTAGRDKIARLLQYASRVIWNRLQNSNKDKVNSFKNLEYQLSTFRKLLRFGRFIDVFYSITPLFKHPDATIRNSMVLSRLAQSLFLFADHFLWIGRADVHNVNTDTWSTRSNKYWLYSIAMNLLRDLYEIYNLLKNHKNSIVPASGVRNFDDAGKTLTRAVATLAQNRNIIIDTVRNACDFFIPLTALGHTNFSPETVGWLGVISSAVGILVLIDPKLKID